MILRAVRNGSVARANGHTLRGVRANGPVAFINDADHHNAIFAKTLARRGRPLEVKWDTNSAVHDLPPPNGWTHPFLFYDCTFGDTRYAYSLLNVDSDKGVVRKRIDF